MAEESGVYELQELEKQLQSLLQRYSSDGPQADGEPFCSDFCKLVEEYASRWQVPLPQLRILEIALCYFARASTVFASNCDHVLRTLSSLALSLFELLLFFDQNDFHQEPLKQFTVTFQECYLVLAKHQNVHLLQVEHSVQGGGPWAGPALQAILSESSLPQNEVDGYISSELPVFFELRVRYLLSCERVSEALALARCCAQHPIAGQHLFFLQVYLTSLYKTSQHDRLHKEVADLSGKDAVHIICSLEYDEEDELLLGLSTAFLSQQLRKGDMYCLCDLVFVWTKLHSRLNTSKQALLQESQQLMSSATNVNSIFPFIRAILQEVGEDGIQYCVELCANALQSCLPCDVITKTLIYKTIAGLLPNDLEVCRACALLVFFLERTVESYKMVYLLYMHPDQEYGAEDSPIRNHIRFETLQILKKDLYFDPEFWNLIALRTNCLKLMGEKVESAALEEIMEDKWISNYCTKEPTSRSKASVCHKRRKSALQAAARKRHHKGDRHHKDGTDTEPKRLKLGPGKTRLKVDHTGKKKGNKVSQSLKDASCQPLRRSFWQLDRTWDSVAMRYAEQRRTTRLSEKNLPKRRIRKPRWLVEDSATLERNNVPLKMKKNGLKHEKHHRSCVMKSSEMGQIKDNGKHKPSAYLKARESNNKHQKEFDMDGLKSPPSPQVILELSLPDNELMGTFTEEHRGFPQVLLYKPTVKIPDTSQSVKTVHRKEVILRARDAAMFAQQLHCYARRQKGKGNGLSVHGSVSTITRSSVQGSPPKDPPRELCEKSDTEVKGGVVTRTTAAKDAESPVSQKVLQVRKTSSARGLFEKSAVEMKGTVASQRPAAAKVTKSPVLNKIAQDQSTGRISECITLVRERSERSTAAKASQASAAAKGSEAPTLDAPPAQTVASSAEVCDEPAVEMKVTIASQSPVLDKVSKAPTVEDVSEAGVSQTSAANKDNAIGQISPASNKHSVAQDVVLRGGDLEIKSSQTESVKKYSKERTEDAHMLDTDQGSVGDISALTLVTEMVTELAPERLSHNLENDKQRAPGNSASKVSRVGSKLKVPHKIRTTSSRSVPEQEASVDDVQGQKGKERTQDISDQFEDCEFMENPPESEESKLEYCCTFCNKDFKGSRVVAHAMFHYRKDECMFCGTTFKDDLLAMMHLSDHIEKLKRIKAQENGVSDTKETSSPKTSAKAKTTNMPAGCRKRQKTSKLINRPELSQSETRRLRSNDKAVDGPSLQKKHNAAKHLQSKTAVHKLNGHIGKQKEFDSSNNLEAKTECVQQEICQGGRQGVKSRSQEKQESEVETIKVEKESSENKIKESKSPPVLKMATKQGVMVDEEPQEKVCCPIDGCSWFTDLSKNRVALLYHALDDHYGEMKPLELAFRVGNGKCNICMRVLWSFEHFQHHVERHRLAPRHPCLHKGCTARFKTGIEMRRHTRKHSPLQAACCLPGCSQLFICLWALNLHEREHYASKSSKPDKKVNVQTGEKNNDATVERKKQNHGSKHTTAPADVNETQCLKTAPKLREQARHDSPESKRASTPSASQVKLESKERNEGKNSNVLKNLSNKDCSAQPTVPNLRLRHTLRKGQVTTTNRAHKGFSSSLLKHTRKARHKLRKRQVKVNPKWPKRKGRPPKLSTVVHDENTQKNEGFQEKTSPQNDQQSTGRIPSPETVKSKKLAIKQTKRNQENNASSSKGKNRSAHSDSRKTKNISCKVNKKTVISSASKKPATSKSDVPQEDKAAIVESSADMETAKVENTDSTESVSSTSNLSAPDSTLNTSTTTEKQHKVKTKEKLKNAGRASSDSAKARKRHTDVNKKGDGKRVKENRPRKDKKSVKSKCEVQQQDEAKGALGKSSLGEEGKEKEDATLGSSGPSVANPVNEKAKVKTQKVAKKEKSNVTKNRKRKDINKEDDAKIVKKVKGNGHESLSKKPEISVTEVRPLAEAKAGVGQEEKPPPTVSGPGYHLINGQARSEDAKSSVCKDTLATYGKKPYMRLPPTAYLDEKYITMRKRRKEAVAKPSQRSSHPEPTSAATALQRQRCANCFATFNSAEELQSHVQLQKCSNIFGFDSDDEGVAFN
ncbi:zinc finger protein 654-like [Mugil cephalus]|uniref:zinc finger protein 654-like n=1 Tax=Mugil cephalus TaxID=48193 RepID=UPI001FB85164|nr:zinc finger protein 654-like [Mugil cephalus]